MNNIETLQSKTSGDTEHVDVLIVGAGISGIGAAHHLKEQCPDKSFLILDTKESFGGTWHQHTYPGIRSDSDLYTFGYRFKPWSGKPIANGQEILDYLEEAIEEDHIDEHIRYQHEVLNASWSSEQQCWLLEARNKATDTLVKFSCNFLWMCQGYYRHAEGYTPDFSGMENFKGRIVHPQTWPEDLDYTNKRVVVIGSGATAATLIPNLADDAAHVTMLQRSPTYFHTGDNRNEMADTLHALDLPEEWVHEIVRRKILAEQKEIMELSESNPELLKEELLKVVRSCLGEDFDVDKHFTPSYRPWQQRLAYVPDGDLFKGIVSGKVSVVTDQIECFTENGILTKSGEELEADIIVTATGFDLSIMGDIAFNVDGTPVDFSKTITYRGILTAGLPNMATMWGYHRTSWTMRVDLICDFVCRLLNHMEANLASVCTPTLREEDANMALGPWIDPKDFNPGYLQRGLHLMPKQGGHEPWIFNSDYYSEKDQLPTVDLGDGTLLFEEPTVHLRVAR